MWPHQQHQYSGIPSLTEQQIDTRQYHQAIMSPDTPGESLTMHQHQREQPARESAICSSNARASRNLAEKQRRDNLNTNIAMMAAMVPIVAGSSRRQDKISILRLAGAFVRTDYTIGQGTPGFLPGQFNSIDFEQLFLGTYEGAGAFLLVVTTAGNIVHISKSVESTLGHAPSELLGKSLYSYIHPDDHEDLTRNLTPEPTKLAITTGAADQPSTSSSESTASNDTKNFREQRRAFNLKIAHRANARGEHTQYKCFEVNGVLRQAEFIRNKGGGNREHTTTGNDIIFVGVARFMQRRLTELTLFEATKSEYVTRHLIDGRIIFCDHRISIVAGYMTEEVSGANAFRFMHADDVRWTMIGLRQMYDRREGYGSSCYRLLSKTGDFIYLRTHGYLELDVVTGVFESFVCVNTLVDEEEGERLIREMKDRYSATINTASRSLMDSENVNSPGLSQPRVEDAKQLEEVIERLLTDLHAPRPGMARLSLNNPPPTDIQYVKAAMYSQQLPPASVQANALGVIPPDTSGKGKGKHLKRDLSLIASPTSSIEDGDEKQRQRPALRSPRQQVAVTYMPDKVIHKISSPVRIEEIPQKATEQPPRVPSQQSAGRCKEIYEIKSNVSSPAVINEDVSSDSNEIHSSAHRGKPDSMLMFLKTDAIEEILDEPSSKRRFEEYEPELPDKRQCPGDFYSNGVQSEEATLQDIIKSNPEILKMLDEIAPSMDLNQEADPAAELIEFVPEQQVNETLRQTYAHLEDRMTYQGSQINELGVVFDHSNLQAQRGNLNELAAEHERQKELMINLRQDHNSIQAKVKQNAGV